MKYGDACELYTIEIEEQQEEKKTINQKKMVICYFYMGNQKNIFKVIIQTRKSTLMIKQRRDNEKDNE